MKTISICATVFKSRIRLPGSVHPELTHPVHTMTAAGVEMETLPVEMVAAILERLPFKERVKARVVCSQWRDLAHKSFAKVKRCAAPCIYPGCTDPRLRLTLEGQAI